MLWKPGTVRKYIFISGYVPEKEAGKVADILENRFDAVVEICDLDEGEESPVQLENNVFSASTEGVVESFGLPKKGEIDPTFIMSFFYVISVRTDAF